MWKADWWRKNHRSNCEYCGDVGILVWVMALVKGDQDFAKGHIHKFRCQKCGAVWWE